MSRINILKHVFTGTASDNTAEGAIIRAGGKHATKTITLSANNTSANVNVFTLTGTVVGLSLHGEITDATTLTNLTAGYFDLWDGTNSIPLTKVTGGILSGMGVGTFIIKTATAASAFTINNNTQVRMSEVSGNKVAQSFVATAKAATTTYLRFTYTTTDTPINAQLKVDIEYADKDSGDFTAV